MPNRIISESVRMSRTINDLSCFECEVMFYRLIVTVDDFGCYYADPDILRSTLFPRKPKVTTAMITKWLTELAQAGLVFVYRVNGDSYLQVSTWAKHQQIRAKRPKYPLPPPDINCYQEISDDGGPQAIAPVFVDDIQSYSESESNPPPADAVQYQQTVDLWNRTVRDLPQVDSLSDGRKRAVRAIWKRMPSGIELAAFEDVFLKVQDSDFLCGRSEKPWGGCGFDWVLKPANWDKIREGTYRNTKGAGGVAGKGRNIGNFVGREYSEDFLSGLYEKVAGGQQ